MNAAFDPATATVEDVRALFSASDVANTRLKEKFPRHADMMFSQEDPCSYQDMQQNSEYLSLNKTLQTSDDLLARTYAATESAAVMDIIEPEVELLLSIIEKKCGLLKRELPKAKHEQRTAEIHSALYLLSRIDNRAQCSDAFVTFFDPFDIAVASSKTGAATKALTPWGQSILKYMNRKFGKSDAQSRYEDDEHMPTPLMCKHIKLRPLYTVHPAPKSTPAP